MTRSWLPAPIRRAMTKLRRLHVLTFFLLLLAASAWPGDSWAQTSVPRLGIVAVGSATDDPRAGRRLEVDSSSGCRPGMDRWHHGVVRDAQRRRRSVEIAAAAAELVALKVDVILADGTPALRATYAATHSIPIVALDLTTDPVADGYAQSYSRPGGNVTGVFLDAPEFSGKWLELLKAMVPGLSSVVVLWDPSPGDAHVRALQGIAPSLGVQPPGCRGAQAGGYRRRCVGVSRPASSPDLPAFAHDPRRECTSYQAGDEAAAAGDVGVPGVR